MSIDGQKPVQGGGGGGGSKSVVVWGGNSRGSVFIPTSFRTLSSYLKIVSSGASTVASTAKSAAFATTTIVDRESNSSHDQILNMEVEHHLPNMEEWKSISAVAAADSEKISAYFDCSICLDFARDPVVTLCGHLYCWPCIYKWFQFQSTSDEQHGAQCPVCKAGISNATVVPLYGRGNTLSEDYNATSPDISIPPRPNVLSRHSQTTTSIRDQQLPHYENYQSIIEETTDPFPAFSNLGSTTTEGGGGGCHPGMFGEMVYARVFGNSESLYAYPTSYCLAGSNNARLRRLERITHKSLSRVSLFLFCCLLLCLLLF